MDLVLRLIEQYGMFVVFFNVLIEAQAVQACLAFCCSTRWAPCYGRVSNADADLPAAVAKFHAGTSPPKVSHYLALDPAAATRRRRRSSDPTVSERVPSACQFAGIIQFLFRNEP